MVGLRTRWSCRCSPTPGRSCTTGMPSAASSTALPTPESCNSCGELNEPPGQDDLPGDDIHPAAGSVRADRGRPGAGEQDLRHGGGVRTVRFGRRIAGCRTERAADTRRPREMSGPRCRNPRLAPSASVDRGWPAWRAARNNGSSNGSVAGTRSRGCGRRSRAAPGDADGAGLQPLEVRQAVGVVPRGHTRVGAPPVVVARVSAREHHRVDAARPAEPVRWWGGAAVGLLSCRSPPDVPAKEIAAAWRQFTSFPARGLRVARRRPGRGQRLCGVGSRPTLPGPTPCSTLVKRTSSTGSLR